MKTVLTDEQKVMWRNWIDALRSGEWRQGRNRLYKPDYGDEEIIAGPNNVNGSYCCLGVISVQNGSSLFGTYLDRDDERKFGITTHLQDHLAYMNDSNRDSFKNIADFLELLLKSGGYEEIMIFNGRNKYLPLSPALTEDRV